MAEILHCSKCKYALPDPTASTRKWTAIECTNCESEYHKALLNVSEKGEMQSYISWHGCELGERKVAK